MPARTSMPLRAAAAGTQGSTVAHATMRPPTEPQLVSEAQVAWRRPDAATPGRHSPSIAAARWRSAAPSVRSSAVPANPAGRGHARSPPNLCPSSATRLKCSGNQDCNPGGTCVFTVSGCPQCQYSACQYPAPPCTPSPDSCAPWGRCQPDAATCAPILCTEGYSCSADSRCAVGSARANANGCELIPCDSGWTCTTNTRCTTPGDCSHGCTPLTCKTDGDCDCGYCVNGTCTSNLGSCSSPPQ